MGINGIGNANAIGFKRQVSGGRVILPPDLKNSLKLVCNCYNKTNDDSDRTIIENLVDPDNPMITSNFVWKLNSGYGKYEEDFTAWEKNTIYLDMNMIIITHNSFTIYGAITNAIFKPIIRNQSNPDIESFKVKISGTNFSLMYTFCNINGQIEHIGIYKEGEYVFPKSYNSHYAGNLNLVKIGFSTSTSKLSDKCTVTQIPNFEHSLVTDGVEDNIHTTKSMTQILESSNSFTVISMINHITSNNNNNHINTNAAYVSNNYKGNYINKEAIDTLGIYGYAYDGTNKIVINEILGDKGLYDTNDFNNATDDKFYVINPLFQSSVAWYWTIIANKVLTYDEINSIIVYYNLDEIISPQIYYDVNKQNLTNENHNTFNNKLIDFSGNNFNANLININWKDNSGVGSYAYNFENVTAPETSLTYKSITVLPTFINNEIFRMRDIGIIPIIKVKISGIPIGGKLIYTVYDELHNLTNIDITHNGVHILPKSFNDPTHGIITKMEIYNHTTFDYKNIVIEQIPEYENALVFDGIDDYAIADNIPALKDYTIIAKRKIINYNKINTVVSKYAVFGVENANYGAYLLFETKTTPKTNIYSFGNLNQVPLCDKDVVYQSKYVYNKNVLTAGQSIDNKIMYIGVNVPTDTRYFANMALYYLMVFPYSMSEFLINRQLKKYKLNQIQS